ncbi:MAG: apolipoprotein acyltransferase, partial [Planctomycetaceae bacterium]
LIQRFETLPRVRVLEGVPPKQLKSDQQSFPLLHAIKVQAATLTDGLAMDCQVVGLLREAYYFTACDAMLRDYLLWPAYADHFNEPDPFAAYFELWKHGVKWRVFHEDMIDVYIPRPQPS